VQNLECQDENDWGSDDDEIFYDADSEEQRRDNW
jgi:hypothetical protein